MTPTISEIEKQIEDARKASPPSSPGTTRKSYFVDIESLMPELCVDLKYSGTDNFLGYAIYQDSLAVLQEPVAQSLAAAQEDLRSEGLGLIIYDAYRPWWVTRVFCDISPSESHTFLADPATGSRHNRGCTVDVGLIRLSDQSIVAMPSEFDEFSERASVSYTGGSRIARNNRDLLIETMSRHDFTVYSAEWWHFDHVLWPKYPILNEPVPCR